MACALALMFYYFCLCLLLDLVVLGSYSPSLLAHYVHKVHFNQHTALASQSGKKDGTSMTGALQDQAGPRVYM